MQRTWKVLTTVTIITIMHRLFKLAAVISEYQKKVVGVSTLVSLQTSHSVTYSLPFQTPILKIFLLSIDIDNIAISNNPHTNMQIIT